MYRGSINVFDRPNLGKTGKRIGAMTRAYRPIADYAAIGDCHGGALVATDGDIDWCALGRFDADPVFCRILDAARGGFLSVRSAEVQRTTRAYLTGTNILRTEVASSTGTLILTDFMPVGRNSGVGPNDYVSLVAPQCLIRRIAFGTSCALRQKRIDDSTL